MTSDQHELESQAQTVIDRTKNQPGVLCPRCNHLNYLDREECARCGTALYVVCPRCKHRNMRVYMRCQKCRKRLKGGRLFNFRRHHRRSFLHRTGWLFFQIFLVLLGIAAVLAIIYLIYRL